MDFLFCIFIPTLKIPSNYSTGFVSYIQFHVFNNFVVNKLLNGRRNKFDSIIKKFKKEKEKGEQLN